MNPQLIVQTPFGEEVIRIEHFKDCRVLICRMLFEVDLIPIRMYDFDAILGMDWLMRHNAQVDCPTKTVVLKKPGMSQVIF